MGIVNEQLNAVIKEVVDELDRRGFFDQGRQQDESPKKRRVRTKRLDDRFLVSCFPNPWLSHMYLIFEKNNGEFEVEWTEEITEATVFRNHQPGFLEKLAGYDESHSPPKYIYMKIGLEYKMPNGHVYELNPEGTTVVPTRFEPPINPLDKDDDDD